MTEFSDTFRDIVNKAMAAHLDPQKWVAIDSALSALLEALQRGDDRAAKSKQEELLLDLRSRRLSQSLNPQIGEESPRILPSRRTRDLLNMICHELGLPKADETPPDESTLSRDV
jgi:hypothetical protein